MKLIHRIGIVCIAFGMFTLLIGLDYPPINGGLVGLGCALLVFFGNDDD